MASLFATKLVVEEKAFMAEVHTTVVFQGSTCEKGWRDGAANEQDRRRLPQTQRPLRCRGER